MTKSLVFAMAIVALVPQVALAQEREQPRPPTLSVAATGSVEYVPDIVRMQLGIRAQASSAAAAANTVNGTASQVIAAIEKQGITQRSIQTSGYNLEYREPQPVQPQSGAMATSAASGGYYVASEIIQVTTPVASAGPVLDAAITAGANTSYGLSYQSSKADGLYRTALARAVLQARSTAEAIAAAAHMKIVAVLSLSNTQQQELLGPQPQFRAMAAAPAPAILPGTDTVSATIFAVYAIK